MHVVVLARECEHVRPLFVAKITWFGIPDFCKAEEQWVGHGVNNDEVHNANNV